jgi:DNA polymerase III delta prime subunit
MNFNEKYRCNSLDEIKGQNYVVSRLKKIRDNIHKDGDDGDLPNLFFSGSPGTGKTNVVTAFLKDCFGENWSDNFKEFNASETKIDEIRNVVIDLAESSVIGDYRTPDGRMFNIPFNIIFFDEIDYLPPKSQAILRRIIEKSARYTRFILSCNYDFKVIDALKSRCMCFNFQRLPNDAIKEILDPIIESEGIQTDSEAIELIGLYSKGDARKAQNILQKASLGGFVDEREVDRAMQGVFTFDKNGKEIKKIDTQLLSKAILANNKDDTNYIKEFNELDRILTSLYWSGQSGTQILINIFDSITEDKEMPIPLKRKILSSIGNCMRDLALSDDQLYTIKMWLRSVQ